MVHRIILDVDTGTDDAVALMVAALSPEIELLGATTVSGNCPLEICTENTLRVFDWIGVDVPVHAGSAQPLMGALVSGRQPGAPRNAPRFTHGSYLDLPAARSRAGELHAVQWLINTLLASAGDITLVAVAPLTNIAIAMRLEPRILPNIKELVIMGGSHEVGNITAAAEFNIWSDPEAARIVINSGRPIRLVPLDATHRALVSLEDCARLQALGTPAAVAAAAAIERRIQGYDAYQPMHRRGAAPVHDALAVCALLEPAIVKTVTVHVDVETCGELTAGRTVCDTHGRGGHEPNVALALDADEPMFVRMLADILGRDARQSAHATRKERTP